MRYNAKDNLTNEYGISDKGAAVLQKIFEELESGEFDADAIQAEWTEAELQDAIGKEENAVGKAGKAMARQEEGSAGRNPYLQENENLADIARHYTAEELSALEIHSPDIAERIVQALSWEDRNERAQARRVASSLESAGDAKTQAEAAHERLVESFRSRFWSLGRDEREAEAARLGIRDIASFAPDQAFGQDGDTGGEAA